jgi:hypothetical protein
MITDIAFPNDPALTKEQNDVANGRPRSQGRNGTYAIGAVELMTMNGGANLCFTPISLKSQALLNAGFDVPAATARAMAQWILDNVKPPQQATPAPGAWTIGDVQRLLPEVDMMTADTEEGPFAATLRQDPLDPSKAYVETWTVDSLIVPWTIVTEAINAGRPLNADDEFAGMPRPEPTPDKVLGRNHNDDAVYLQPTGERYYIDANGNRSATISLNQADFTHATIFYVLRSWFTTDELEWNPNGVTFNGLKE